MWCAYIFAAIALISLPAAIRTGDPLIIVAWVAQTFLQLVLLSIIMVGQSASSDAVAQKITETHTASLGEFELAKEARKIADQELAEIKSMAREIHTILKDVEKK
jgi:purine-nucleoside phosphorylase